MIRIFVQQINRRVALSIFLLFSVVINTQSIANNEPFNIAGRSWEEKLRKDLLHQYDTRCRDSHNETTVVNVALVINNIHLDYQSSVFTVTGLFAMIWKDKRLIWIPKNYGDISDTRFGVQELWKPDIVLYNSADENLLNNFGNTGISVNSSGISIWAAPVSLRAFCKTDLSNWPFDQQHCYLKLGSWIYSIRDIDLRSNRSEVVTATGYGFSSEWKIISVDYNRNEKHYSCCEERYVDITYNITIKRGHNYLGSFILMPSFIITVMVLSLFWMPPQSSEKFILAGLVQIICCLILTYYCDQVPITAYKLPYIVKYYTYLFSFTSIYVFVSVIYFNLSDAQFRCSICPPEAILQFLKTDVAQFLIRTSELEPSDITSRLTNARYVSSDYDVTEDSVRFDSETREQSVFKLYGGQWYLVFIVFERILFLLYVLFFLISYIRLFIIY